MFSTDFIFRQQESLVDNQKCQAEFRQLYNKILFLSSMHKPKFNRNSEIRKLPPYTYLLVRLNNPGEHKSGSVEGPKI